MEGPESFRKEAPFHLPGGQVLGSNAPSGGSVARNYRLVTAGARLKLRRSLQTKL
jgi:hypothetical protein